MLQVEEVATGAIQIIEMCYYRWLTIIVIKRDPRITEFALMRP
jgi:hypothetical protein